MADIGKRVGRIRNPEFRMRFLEKRIDDYTRMVRKEERHVHVAFRRPEVDIYTCRECGGDTIHDEQSGDRVCTSCGVVVCDHHQENWDESQFHATGDYDDFLNLKPEDRGTVFTTSNVQKKSIYHRINYFRQFVNDYMGKSPRRPRRVIQMLKEYFRDTNTTQPTLQEVKAAIKHFKIPHYYPRARYLWECMGSPVPYIAISHKDLQWMETHLERLSYAYDHIPHRNKTTGKKTNFPMRTVVIYLFTRRDIRVSHLGLTLPCTAVMKRHSAMIRQMEAWLETNKL